ncbi:MAG: NAD(P)/FAD-dependent oxidoreductase [Chloroflexota bacterium]|nr:NAD(P)/FAD-dependent oxidoreductase [Chloroflexota bacterium]
MPDETYDVIIIGAGVVGSMLARALSRYQLRVLLLDKASDVGEGATKANTGIVHGGYNAEPGSLKARLNAEGNPMFDELCAQLDVPFERCGTYVVGVTPQDRQTLRDLYRRGIENDVPDLHLIDASEMRRREPAINEDTVGALYSGTGGIIDPFEFCIAAAENAVMNGVNVRLETEALDFVWQDERIVGVVTNRGNYRSRWTIISAGLWADELMHKAGLDTFEIKPRKGEYFVLDRVASQQVHNVLFPCPTPISKGILVTPTVHDNIILGPNADVIEDKEDLRTTPSGLAEVMAGARKLVPDLDQGQVIRTFAGLRAGGNRGDFVIEIPEEVSGLVVLAGIESPGLTASPAIAEYVIALLREAGLSLVERPDYNPVRKGIPRFADLSREEQQALIDQDPRYGRVICRCETVTEGEIVAACHRPIPARTYDAVKRRTRVGTGRCQGAFDTPLVIEIMARELGVSPLEITKEGPGSAFLRRGTKEVRE